MPEPGSTGASTSTLDLEGGPERSMYDVLSFCLKTSDADMMSLLLISICVSELLELEHVVLNAYIANVVLGLKTDIRIVSMLPVVIDHPLIIEGLHRVSDHVTNVGIVAEIIVDAVGEDVLGAFKTLSAGTLRCSRRQAQQQDDRENNDVLHIVRDDNIGMV